MEEECDLNAQFPCIILREKVFFQKMLYLSSFFASMNCSKNHLKSLLSCKDTPA